jgi:retron-type reverse transcriptase
LDELQLLIMEERIYVLWVAESKHGPYTRKEIETFIAEGRTRSHDLIWNLDDPGWKQVSESGIGTFLDSSTVPVVHPTSDRMEETIEGQAEDPGVLLEKQLAEEFACQPAGEKEKSGYRRSQQSHSQKPLSEWLGMERETLCELAEETEANYRVFPIEGRSKKRWIEAPSEPLKQVQRKILDRLLESMPLNGAAHGFIRDRSILSHAANHVKKRWVINLDIRSFFPSVDSERVHEVALELPISPSDAELFVKLTTRKNHLPQGAPTSPALGNLVLRGMDRKMCDLVRGTGWFYTRYADDLTLSGFRKPRQIFDDAIAIVHESGFQTSAEKCRIRGRNRRQMVTGIVVNRKLALPREKRRMVRAMKHRWEKGLVEGCDMNHVLGWINFASYVEYCDRTFPSQGSVVRPRIAFFKLLLVRKFFSEGLSLNEIARRAEISPSSVSRVLNYYYELLERRLPNAPPEFIRKTDLTVMDSMGTSLLHAVAIAGRIGLVRPEVISRATLLQLDSAGRTVLGQVLRAADEASLPPTFMSEELTEEASSLEKIYKLTVAGQAKHAADLAKAALPDDSYSNLVRPMRNSVLPAWVLGAAHGFSGLPSLTDYYLNNGLIPNYVWSRNDILSKAALLYFPFLELAGENALKYLQLSLEGNGVTILHALAMTSALDQVPEKFLRVDFFTQMDSEGRNVFDLAREYHCIDQLPDKLVDQWRSSKE